MCAIKYNTNNESLIKYPCRFPIKVIGKQYSNFCNDIITLVQQYDPNFDKQHIELRGSKNGNYVGITITVWAINRLQLDSLYHALRHHSMVKIVF